MLAPASLLIFCVSGPLAHVALAGAQTRLSDCVSRFRDEMVVSLASLSTCFAGRTRRARPRLRCEAEHISLDFSFSALVSPPTLIPRPTATLPRFLFLYFTARANACLAQPNSAVIVEYKKRKEFAVSGLRLATTQHSGSIWKASLEENGERGSSARQVSAIHYYPTDASVRRRTNLTREPEYISFYFKDNTQTTRLVRVSHIIRLLPGVDN